MKNNPLPRLDTDEKLRNELLPYCRLKPGEIWVDPINGHKVGCLDAANGSEVRQLMGDEYARLAIHDPPYNLVAFQERTIAEFINWCKQWVANSWRWLDEDSALYIWLGPIRKITFNHCPIS
jgi:site-specific DNA-methyltransferase (adenine-specific)